MGAIALQHGQRGSKDSGASSSTVSFGGTAAAAVAISRMQARVAEAKERKQAQTEIIEAQIEKDREVVKLRSMVSERLVIEVDASVGPSRKRL